MKTEGHHLSERSISVGIDLGSEKHSVVALGADGKRVTSFQIPHSLAGFAELVRRCEGMRRDSDSQRAAYAFEATGHVWEALAHFLSSRGLPYAIVNPLATFRVREARQLDRDKRDITDAEQIAHLLRSGMVTRGRLHDDQYMSLRRAWREYVRLRDLRARLKTLIKHQLYGLFPELATHWKNTCASGLLCVLRLGMTPAEIARLEFSEFWEAVRELRNGRRIQRFKILQVHQKAQKTVAAPQGMAAAARELKRVVARVDALTGDMEAVGREIQEMLERFEEARFLATLPGIGWVTIAGLIAEIGPIDRFRHGRQLVKLAGINPSRHESGRLAGRTTMTHRGRAGLRQVVYMATISSIAHNPRIKAHYERLKQRPDRPLPKMQALGACMTKLLLYVFAVAKRRQPFDLDHRWEGYLDKTAA